MGASGAAPATTSSSNPDYLSGNRLSFAGYRPSSRTSSTHLLPGRFLQQNEPSVKNILSVESIVGLKPCMGTRLASSSDPGATGNFSAVALVIQ